MTLLEALRDEALGKAGEKVIADVRIGTAYTAVQFSSGAVGLAYMFRDTTGKTCAAAGAAVAHVLEWLLSDDLLERTVALAAANALFNTADAVEGHSGWAFREGDLLDVLDLSAHDRVGMVGFFPPLAPIIRQRAGELIVFEEHMDRADGLLPGYRALELLPTCTVAIITATSIINKSFEPLAAASAGCRVKALLGPSTPLAPDIFKDYGITHLSGIIPTDAQQILRVVGEAGGARDFMKWSKKINLAREAGRVR